MHPENVLKRAEHSEAEAIEAAICDECPGKVDFNDSGDFIPEVPYRVFHHCNKCGLVNYRPPKPYIKPPMSEQKRRNRYLNWWNHTTSQLSGRRRSHS